MTEYQCMCAEGFPDRCPCNTVTGRAPEGWEDELNAAWAEVNKARSEAEALAGALERAIELGQKNDDTWTDEDASALNALVNKAADYRARPERRRYERDLEGH